MTINRQSRSKLFTEPRRDGSERSSEFGQNKAVGGNSSDISPGAKDAYSKPVLIRHGKVTDLTLGGSPSTLDLESDGSIGRFGTPKN